MKLGVNVDHVATLRQARGTIYPDPVTAALLCEHAGCDSIVVHLREDRRHIRERDVALIKKTIKIPLNLEMSAHKRVVAFACDLYPAQATLVPERRKELTTEGGLNLIKNYKKVEETIKKLRKSAIKISLFIDPTRRQIIAAKKLGADLIEINSGKFSEARSEISLGKEFCKIKEATKFAQRQGFFVACGHGLDYENVKKIARIKGVKELNIGHSIICRSLFTGIVSAVEEMLNLIQGSP